jgi:hypothetical protein
MRAAIAACLGLDEGAVGVKATTNEGMGFVGSAPGGGGSKAWTQSMASARMDILQMGVEQRAWPKPKGLPLA